MHCYYYHYTHAAVCVGRRAARRLDISGGRTNFPTRLRRERERLMHIKLIVRSSLSEVGSIALFRAAPNTGNLIDR